MTALAGWCSGSRGEKAGAVEALMSEEKDVEGDRGEIKEGAEEEEVEEEEKEADTLQASAGH